MSLVLVPFEDAPTEEDRAVAAALPGLRHGWYAQGRLGCYLCAGQLSTFTVAGGAPNVCAPCRDGPA